MPTLRPPSRPGAGRLLAGPLALVPLALVLGAALPSGAEALAGAEAAHHGARIESEVKLSFPREQSDALFAYVSQELGRRSQLAGYGPLRVETSRELFTDVYFDTPGWALLEAGHGVRHRSREMPDDPTHRKAGRQLVQVKTAAPSDDGSGVRRLEYKYQVDPAATAPGARLAHPLLGLLPPREHVPFEERVGTLGISAWDLSPVLTLEQVRRRVYISDPAGALATVTVDEVDARKAWLVERSAEVELEMNEIRFTGASGAERARMEAFAVAIQDALEARFPELRQDQTPKYEKAVAALAARIPGFRRFGALPLAGPPLAVAALGIALVAYAALERRRVRRRRPRGGRVGERVAPSRPQPGVAR